MKKVQRVLLIDDTVAGGEEIASALEKKNVRCTCTAFDSFDPEILELGEYELCLFLLEKGREEHLQSLRSIRKTLRLSAEPEPPLVFIVEESRAAFEQSARIAEIDIYLTPPIDEKALSSLLKLKPPSADHPAKLTT